APVWTRSYGPAHFDADLRRSAEQKRALSVYVHIPFCAQLCYYCACTKEIVPDRRRREDDPGEAFLEALQSEADRLAEILGDSEVRQVHLGGGSPTFLLPGQLERLGAILRRFPLAADAEAAVEIDPRVTTRAHLETLRGLGFNRASLGVQDFDPYVQ